ncbi:MAG TPA: GNAT family N-acetyltransferase [Actinophytocola sp.]|uniref:GNAT family N-acetyltransferase n=1 Tax=Actinophytocola sp. TaxID=1872138 RepID=UPI002DB883DA|nr:GNAT family N-acetyltransferase [Actinophytocola sp.]HEU5471553.1 GNAT family N-acetyltransferase [Actinophytocola sp.]
MSADAYESALADRKIIASRGGVVLAELLDGERDRLRAEDDGAFDVDDDGRETTVALTLHALAVLDETSGALLGSVSWHGVTYGRTVPCEAWNIGIGLLPAARGRGVGSIAQRLLVEHLFATTDVDRIEAGTEVDNVAERRALARAGFQPEGVLRGVAPRGGVRRDYVHYGLLRTDLRAETGERVIVAERDGVALAEPLRGEREWALEATVSEFDLDQDRRPTPLPPNHSAWLTVLDPAQMPVGGVSWHVVSYGGTLGCLAWRIGIGLVPAARGRGLGTAAHRLLAEYLFATSELDRIEAHTDVDNAAEQRALHKAGFTHEGVVRGAQLRGGVRRDVALYGLLRADLEEPGRGT